MNYLQKLFCQMALAKKITLDFNEVFAPKITQSPEQEQQVESEIDRQDSPNAVREEQTTHVDNTLLETQAREKNEITVTKLLVSDSLNKQEEVVQAQEEDKYEDEFDVIDEPERKKLAHQKSEKIKKGTNL